MEALVGGGIAVRGGGGAGASSGRLGNWYAEPESPMGPGVTLPGSRAPRSFRSSFTRSAYLASPHAEAPERCVWTAPSRTREETREQDVADAGDLHVQYSACLLIAAHFLSCLASLTSVHAPLFSSPRPCLIWPLGICDKACPEQSH